MTENTMYKTTVAIAFSAALAGLGGCASKEALVGTAAGAAVGSAVGGSTMSTVAGGVVGYPPGQRYEGRKHQGPRTRGAARAPNGPRAPRQTAAQPPLG